MSILIHMNTLIHMVHTPGWEAGHGVEHSHSAFIVVFVKRKGHAKRRANAQYAGDGGQRVAPRIYLGVVHLRRRWGGRGGEERVSLAACVAAVGDQREPTAPPATSDSQSHACPPEARRSKREREAIKAVRERFYRLLEHKLRSWVRVLAVPRKHETNLRGSKKS